MGGAVAASGIERLLARLSGEVAPIWVTFGLVVDEAPDEARLLGALEELGALTPRLQLGWEEPAGRWRHVGWSAERARAALVVDHAPMTRAQLHAQTLAGAVALEVEPGLRLRVQALEGDVGPWAMVFQLHHALGDARAFARMTRRLWQLYHAPGSLEGPWGGPPGVVSDRRLLGMLARGLPWWLGALRASSLLLMPRGGSLQRGEATGPIGAPTVATRRLTPRAAHKKRGALVVAAVAAEAAARLVPGSDRVRLRMPVDLATRLGVDDVLANTCVAIPVELDGAQVRAVSGDGARLVALTQGAFVGAIRRGVPYVAVWECLVTARLVGREGLRRGARPGLVAQPRTNTLVVTYVGGLDETFAGQPGRILDAWGHTPTWGVNAWSLGEGLYVNASCFEGLWTGEELEGFVEAVAARIGALDEELWG